MKLPVKVLAILAIFTFVTTLSGCLKNINENENKADTTATIDISVSTDVSNSLKSNILNEIIAAASTRDITKIRNILSKNFKDNFSISHSGQKAFFCADGNKFLNIFYLDFLGQTPVIKNLNTLNGIEEDVFHTNAWSYDDKYFSIVSCTGVVGSISVFNAADLKEIYSTAAYMVGGAVWSPSSDSIVLSIPNNNVSLHYQGGELEYSTDVVIYNADKLSERVVLPADPKYVYSDFIWDNSGITATKHYINDSATTTSETVKLNIFE